MVRQARHAALVAALAFSASAAAGDVIGAFADALEAALAESAGRVTLYTVDEPDAFRIWSAVPPMLSTFPCARNVALAVESGGQQRGVVWFGVCTLGGELPADLLATAEAYASAAAKEPEIAPTAAGLGPLLRKRRLAEGADLTEVTVISNRNGALRVLRTALIQPDGRRELLVVQYEALRLCGTGDAPLCSAPAPTLDALAQRLLRAL